MDRELGNGLSDADKRDPYCFVIMPYGAGNEYQRGVIEANFVYNKIILPAVEECLGEGKAIRATDRFETGNITSEIIRCIYNYEFAIVDITGLNPNVFYELGVRHSLRRSKTIVLKQEGGRAPFDIQGYRYIEYSPFQYEIAKESLVNTIEALQENEYRVDSVVFDVLGDYEIIRKRGPDQNIVPWSLVFQAIDQIVERLQAAKPGVLERKVTYQPDILLGITNGGMLFAELLYRTLRDRNIYDQSDCILHALWAERYPHAVFDNNINRGMLGGFVGALEKDEADIRVLLLDDNSGTGQTASVAKEFIKKLYPRIHVRYLPLFYKNPTVYNSVSDFLLWNHRAFELSRLEVDSIHYVEQAEFPYKKHIRDSVDITDRTI